MDGPQPGVPRASAVFAGAFQVIEEKTDEGGIEVFDPELGGTFVAVASWQTSEAGESNRDIPLRYEGSLAAGEANDR